MTYYDPRSEVVGRDNEAVEELAASKSAAETQPARKIREIRRRGSKRENRRRFLALWWCRAIFVFEWILYCIKLLIPNLLSRSRNVAVFGLWRAKKKKTLSK